MRRLVYQASQVVGGALLAPFTRFQLEGEHHLPQTGPVILASNHISYFDPPFISRCLRRQIEWMAMAELFQVWWARPWLHAVGCIPVDRSRVDRQAVKIALQRLANGHALGIFPEGGIRTPETSVLNGGEIRPGVSALAQMSETPVVPCVIQGSTAFESRAAWIPGKRRVVHIRLGEAFRCERAGKHAREEFEQELSRRWRALSAGLTPGERAVGVTP